MPLGRDISGIDSAGHIGTGDGIFLYGQGLFYPVSQGHQTGALVSLWCYPECDYSGPSVLDIFDFLCFQNRFAAGHSYACDCDTSTGVGVCDIWDFLCYSNWFVWGC